MSMLKNPLKIKCGEGRTKQKTGQEHDINKLVQRYQKTGVLLTLRDDKGIFADVCSVGDYQQCQERVLVANEIFDGLPSVVRSRFGHRPAAFVEFMSHLDTEEKMAEAEALGLIVRNKKDVVNNADGGKSDVKKDEVVKSDKSNG